MVDTATHSVACVIIQGNCLKTMYTNVVYLHKDGVLPLLACARWLQVCKRASASHKVDGHFGGIALSLCTAFDVPPRSMGKGLERGGWGRWATTPTPPLVGKHWHLQPAKNPTHLWEELGLTLMYTPQKGSDTPSHLSSDYVDTTSTLSGSNISDTDARTPFPIIYAIQLEPAPLSSLAYLATGKPSDYTVPLPTRIYPSYITTAAVIALLAQHSIPDLVNFRMWPQFYPHDGPVALTWHAFGTAVRFVAAADDHLVIPVTRADRPLLWRKFVLPYSIKLGILLAQILTYVMTIEFSMSSFLM